MLELNSEQNAEGAAEQAASVTLRLDGLFQDGLVLQHGRVFPITGHAAPGAMVTVSIASGSFRACASEEGRFTVFLPPLEPAEGLVMRVESDGSIVEARDVAIGKLVLASGQSNMEFSLSHCKPGSSDLKTSDYDGIRFFKVPLRTALGEQGTLPGVWRRASSEEAESISGAAFFFARALRRETGMVVGFIDASHGGTSIEAWLSRESLAALPDCRDELAEYEANVSSPGKFPDGKLPPFSAQLDDMLKGLFPTLPSDDGEDSGFSSEKFDDSSWQSMQIPDSWTQAGHNHAGIFWFRRSIDVPAEFAAGKCVIHLGAIDKADKVFVNGTLAGSTGDGLDMAPWAKLRVYELPMGLLHAGANSIAVQALSFESICEDGGMLGPESEMYIETAAGRIPLAGEWKLKCTFDAGVEGMTCMRLLGAGAPTSYHILHDNFIAPLGSIPFAAVLWYQGEADAICLAQRYRACLSELIRSWRRRFCDPQLPFLVVQLPDYHNPHVFAPFSQWALLREAQQLACSDCDADCIVTIGTGDVVELHCPDKQSLGERAARFMLARMEGRKASGPIPRSVSRDGRRLRLLFDSNYPLDTTSRPECMVIADADGHASKADFAFESPTAMAVWSDSIHEPCAVWYAWGDNPVGATLIGADGMPASPFRLSIDGGFPQTVNLIHI